MTGTEDVREAPRTARGRRTRAALVTAARVVFERDGYLNARLTDITAEASMATGTFYTYFVGKPEIFAAVIEDLQEEMLHPRIHARAGSDVAASIEASNRSYLESYRKNARLMALMEQVAVIDDEFRVTRRRRSNAFVERNARSIRELQSSGLADPDLDPELAARTLSAMVSRLAYRNFALDEPEGTFEELVFVSTRLWINALRLHDAAPPTGDDQDARAPDGQITATCTTEGSS